MTTYISILRGINVGGHNMIKMDVLCQLYIDLGFSDIQSYIQSGNIIFCSDTSDTLFLEKTIHEMIFQTLGWNVPVIILTIEELKKSLENNPFIKDSTKDPAFMHLTFLSDIPDKVLIETISNEIYLPDEFQINNKIIYLYCPNGYGKSKLTNTFFENRLKCVATTRNLKTSSVLLTLAENKLLN